MNLHEAVLILREHRLRGTDNWWENGSNVRIGYEESKPIFTGMEAIAIAKELATATPVKVLAGAGYDARFAHIEAKNANYMSITDQTLTEFFDRFRAIEAKIAEWSKAEAEANSQPDVESRIASLQERVNTHESNIVKFNRLLQNSQVLGADFRNLVKKHLGV